MLTALLFGLVLAVAWSLSTLGVCSDDLLRHPLVLLAVAMMFPVVKDAAAAGLRRVGLLVDEHARDTPTPRDDEPARVVRSLAEAIADALERGDTDAARKLLDLLRGKSPFDGDG